jgi:hypothetical protein
VLFRQQTDLRTPGTYSSLARTLSECLYLPLIKADIIYEIPIENLLILKYFATIHAEPGGLRKRMAHGPDQQSISMHTHMAYIIWNNMDMERDLGLRLESWKLLPTKLATPV